jgi:uncharacterized protein YnzC (UPF0291/DUF896 family)
MKELLPRINELARKEKCEKLSSLEKEEQALLRRVYLIMFRSAFKNMLLHTTVIDPLGNDVTPMKLKREQCVYRAKRVLKQ